MKVQIDPHTLERAEERGTNEDEIKDVIRELRYSMLLKGV